MGVRVLAVGAALLAAASQVPGLVSTERIRASESALAAGDSVRAGELANEAVTAEPWAASPYAMRALVAAQEGRLPDARREIDEAIEREPTNWRHWLVRARIEAGSGDRSDVDRALAEVRMLAPDAPFLLPQSRFRTELGQLLRRSAPGTSP